jgi:hypothetical protein
VTWSITPVKNTGQNNRGFVYSNLFAGFFFFSLKDDERINYTEQNNSSYLRSLFCCYIHDARMEILKVLTFWMVLILPHFQIQCYILNLCWILVRIINIHFVLSTFTSGPISLHIFSDFRKYPMFVSGILMFYTFFFQSLFHFMRLVRQLSLSTSVFPQLLFNSFPWPSFPLCDIFPKLLFPSWSRSPSWAFSFHFHVQNLSRIFPSCFT